MKKSSEPTIGDVLAELTAIKRLFVSALLRTGASQNEVAEALGTSQSHVSKMFSSNPGRASRKKR